MIYVYESINIQACFNQIEQEKPMFEINYCMQEGFEKPRRLLFDRNDRYFIIVFKTKLIIYSLEEGKESAEVNHYDIPQEKFEEIHDINFISNPEGSEYPY